ncbi:hypothetical protein [Brucella pseudogrignonensis]|uniref:hypothetical protein n=1 Tax=Brucella pseudogrignonensis TaxID=419475 RepID=UPI000DE50B43|nr:hypothetical protein [Brucella pseudogrignonensis]KAB2689116.1 hypothetical protein F9K82_10650 [Brucella pseudogrignonensis]
MSIDQVIEELRAELLNAVYRGKLREIKAAPELAFAKRETIWAEQETIMMAEPAFWEAFAPQHNLIGPIDRSMRFQLFNDKLAQLWITSELAQPCSAVFANVVGYNAMIAIIVWNLGVPKAVTLDLAIDC